MLAPSGLPASLAGVDRTLVMGILNVTPDSFSDGGRWSSTDAAIARGIDLHSEGADLVDVGGESTRPGAQRISVEDELARVLPVVRALASEGIAVSIDTMRAEVAAACVDAGAVLVNDVSGGQADPLMLPWLASVTIPYVAMHWRGPSDVMEDLATYGDVVSEVVDELAERLQALADAGVDPDRVVLDPGLGFAKRSPHNWALLRDLEELESLGRPLLVGASRKRFLGDLLAGADGAARPMEGRDAAGDAVTALAAYLGVWCVRVHEVRASRDAVLVAQAWKG
ncbi:MAG: dihydropteroate synthase [Actinomycetota bacterium]